MTNFCSTYSK